MPSRFERYAGLGLVPTPVRLLFALLALGCACAPHLTAFTADPPYVCSGTPTTLKWEAVGEPTLVAEPPVGDFGSLPSKGERRISVNRNTVFTMTVHRNGKQADAGRQEVTFLETSHPQSIQVNPKSCDAGAVVFESEVPNDNWPGIVHVAAINISEPFAADVVVQHATRSGTIGHGQTATTDLAGTPVTGVWRAILKTARCEDAPDTLVLSTTLSCSPVTGG